MSSSWYEYTQNFDVLDGSEAAWPVSALAIDQQSELVYTGDISGRVTAYMLGAANEALEKQSICVCSHSPIRQLHGFGNSVLVRSDDSVQLRTSGGSKLYGKTTPASDVFTSSALNRQTWNEVITCTTSGSATVLTLDRGTTMKRFTMELSTTAMDYTPQALTLATMTGTLAVRDPRAAFKVTQAVSAYSGPVSDMALHDYTLFACGMSMDASTSYEMTPGSTVKVFDVRKFSTAVDEIVCEGVPNQLQVTDKNLWVCYDSGYAEVRPLASFHEPSMDFVEPSLSDYAYMSAFCVAPTESVAVVSDTDGMVHVWTNTGNPILSLSGEVPPTIMSDEQHAQAYETCGLNIDDESVSLSSVCMPEYTEPLLSRFSTDTLYDVGRPCSYVDPNILGNLKHMDGVGYAPNPRSTKRNQQPYGMGWRRRWKEGTTDDGELTQGRSKFISVQRRCGLGRDNAEYIQQQQQVASPTPAAAALPNLLNGGRTASFDTVSRNSPVPVATPSVSGKVPTNLQQMRIEYSRFGVEDFDFSLYNSTRWGGLEGNITNSYANALLQVLFFVPELREIALSHCATDCPESLCLTCQLGLLFRMLETADGSSCHATHLLHVIRQRPEAVALALLEDAHGNPTDGASYSVLTQRLLRFVLEQANNECVTLGITGQGPTMSKRVVEAIIGFPQATQTTCPVCSSQQSRDSHVFAVDLDSPYGSADLAMLLAGGSASVKRAEQSRRKNHQGVAELIEQALCKSETTRAWCAQCKKFQLLQTEKYMTRVPTGYLAVNFPMIDGQSSASSGT
ncbi:poly(A)-specific ribonuclease, partial [Linderina macrospora]